MLYFVLGSIIGSFLNVVILRLPNNESILSPRSHCPRCKNPIPIYQNIPIISYILLKGKCSNCYCAISPQYILKEIITGFIFYMTFSLFSLEKAILYSLIYSCMIVLGVIDLYHLLIPLNLIVLLYFSLIAKLFINNQSIIEIIFGALAVVSYLVFSAILVRLIKANKEVLGFGDILLAIFIGGCLGPINGLLCLFLASVIGLIFVFIRYSKSLKIPFGTCIAISFIIISMFDSYYDIKSFII